MDENVPLSQGSGGHGCLWSLGLPSGYPFIHLCQAFEVVGHDSCVSHSTGGLSQGACHTGAPPSLGA